MSQLETLQLRLRSLHLPVRAQDIVNTFGHAFYLAEGSGHREQGQAVLE